MEHIGEIRRADQARPFPGGDSSSMEDGMGTLDAPLYFEQLQLLLEVGIFVGWVCPICFFAFLRLI